MIVGGLVEDLIPQNTTVPTSRSKIFTTIRDNQTAVKILVLQGEQERAEDNELLGEFVLTGLRRAPRGEVEVEVSFEINADGIVSVSAKDLETGQEQSITVTASSGLTADEVKAMAADSADYLVERRATEEVEQKRQQCQRLIEDVEKLFPKVEDAVSGSEFGQDALGKAQAVISRANHAIDRQDMSGLIDAIDALERTSRMFKGVVAKMG